jgi:hypothetical protein
VSTVDAQPSAPGGFASEHLEHLRLLSIFHYVVAGLIALVSLLPGLQLVLGLLMAGGQLAPEDEGSRVAGFCLSGCASFFLALGLGFAALIALAGRSLAERRRYTYCLVAATILCLFVPFGTVLGVLTIVVLVQPPVKALFGIPAPAALERFS